MTSPSQTLNEAPKIDYADVALAEHIALKLSEAIIGGSYIVLGRYANDIDVIIPDYRLTAFVNAFDEFERQITEAPNSDRYADVHELIATFRHGKVNVLVYKADFMPAIKAAVRDMHNAPWMFETREQRIELHQKHKDVIRKLLGFPLYFEE